MAVKILKEKKLLIGKFTFQKQKFKNKGMIKSYKMKTNLTILSFAVWRLKLLTLRIIMIVFIHE